MSDPKAGNGDNTEREVGTTGTLLQTDNGWNLEVHVSDNGPVLYHDCGYYIVDLNRRYPLCRKCGDKIPPSMISGFTMLNWNQADDDEYFVPFGQEVLDFVYNGHLEAQLIGIGNHLDGVRMVTDSDVDMEQVNAAIAKWKEGLT